MRDPTIESGCPIQLLSLAFPGSTFKGTILPELDRLKRKRVIRVLDMLLVRKDAKGNVLTATASDLDWDEATRFGAYAGALSALATAGPGAMAQGEMKGAAELADGHVFDEQDAFNLTRTLPDGTTGVLILLQHLWSQPLLDAVHDAGGIELFNTWVEPSDLLQFERALPPEGDG